MKPCKGHRSSSSCCFSNKAQMSTNTAWTALSRQYPCCLSSAGTWAAAWAEMWVSPSLKGSYCSDPVALSSCRWPATRGSRTRRAPSLCSVAFQSVRPSLFSKGRAYPHHLAGGRREVRPYFRSRQFSVGRGAAAKQAGNRGEASHTRKRGRKADQH